MFTSLDTHVQNTHTRTTQRVSTKTPVIIATELRIGAVLFRFHDILPVGVGGQFMVVVVRTAKQLLERSHGMVRGLHREWHRRDTRQKCVRELRDERFGELAGRWITDDFRLRRHGTL